MKTILYSICIIILSSCSEKQEPIIYPPSGKLFIEGDSINYEVVGYGSYHQKQLLVVIPGGPGLGFGYLKNDISKVLESDFQLFFYDQRGCGHSTLNDTSKISLEVFVDDLEVIRRKLGVGRISILGHSFGGIMAMHYALKYPQWTDRLILVESDPASFEEWNSFRRVIGERVTPGDSIELNAIRSEENWLGSSDTYERYMKVYLRTYFYDRKFAKDLYIGLDDVVLQNYFSSYSLIRAGLDGYNIHERLNELNMPVLLLYGDHSIFPKEAIHNLNKSIAISELKIIEKSGHFPYLENPDQFVKEVSLFIESDD